MGFNSAFKGLNVSFHVLRNPHDNSSVCLNKSFAIDRNRYLINSEILARSFVVFRSSVISASRTHGCLMYKDKSRQHITVHVGLHLKGLILAQIGIFQGSLVKMQTWYFRKIRPAGDTLLHAERQTDGEAWHGKQPPSGMVCKRAWFS